MSFYKSVEDVAASIAGVGTLNGVYNANILNDKDMDFRFLKGFAINEDDIVQAKLNKVALNGKILGGEGIYGHLGGNENIAKLPFKAAADVKAYYSNEAFGTRRIVGTIGAYAGLSLGVRSIAGGTATRNNKGERDIAGVPFI